MDSENQIMIAARPGIMRNSLLSYFRAVPGVRAILLADDVAAALLIVRENSLKLAVVDTDLTEKEMLVIVKGIRIQRPATKLIVLVESIRQQQLSLAAGADYALLKGFLDEPLRQAVVDVIGEVNQNEHKAD